MYRTDQHTPKQRTELTPDEKQELAEAFAMFDAEQTGRIDLHELKVPHCGCVVLCRCALVCSAPRVGLRGCAMAQWMPVVPFGPNINQSTQSNPRT